MTFPSDINPAQIMQDMSDKIRLLESKNAEFRRLVEQKAEAEEIYSVAVSQKMLRYKAEDMPVTLINKIVAGETAKLKLNYEIASGMVKACEKSMKILECGIDTDRSKLSWLKTERMNQ